MIADNNVYRKVVSSSGRISYKPFGIRIRENYLPDGLWYIRHKDYSLGTTDANYYLPTIYKVGEPYYTDLPSILGQHDCVDYILNHEEFKKVLEKPHTLLELTSKIVSLVVEFKKKKMQDDKERINK